MNVQVENGRIIFKGDEIAIARSNLWLRTADRLKLKLENLRQQLLMNLFEKTKALPWEKFLTENANFLFQVNQ